MPARVRSRVVAALAAGVVIGPLAACSFEPDPTNGQPTTFASTTAASTSPSSLPTSTAPQPETSTTSSAPTPSEPSSESSTPAPTKTKAPTPTPTQSESPSPSPTTSDDKDEFTASIDKVSDDDVRHTYRSGCPVGPDDLRKITMSYRNYDGDLRTGVLIVAKKSAKTVVDIFRQAFDNGFRINRMTNPNEWKGDDVKMMAADNTSAFNCRRVTGDEGKLSPHSYGTAIDVNTRRNPYRAANGKWYPENGSKWQDRSRKDAGTLRSSSTLTKAVLKAGGTWGGTWVNPDYQHFELD